MGDTISTIGNIFVTTIEEEISALLGEQKESNGISEKKFITKVIDTNNVVQQRRTENLYAAIKCLNPVDSNSTICKMLKYGRIVSIIRGHEIMIDDKPSIVWAWRSRRDQEHNDRKNRYKLTVIEENKKSLSRRQLLCLERIESVKVKNQHASKFDYDNVKRLSFKQFNLFIQTAFGDFTCRSDEIKKALVEFAKECNARDADYQQRQIEVYVRCERCGRCGETHEDYRVKLDSHNVPYVICGVTQKRIDVLFDKEINMHSLHSLRDILYGTHFTVTHGNEEDIAKLLKLV